jgi:hypothetical protein
MKKIQLILFLLFSFLLQLKAQTKPSVYGTWYISKDIDIDTIFVNNHPTIKVAVLSRKLDFKTNKIKRREVLIIKPNNTISGSKERFDIDKGSIVVKKFELAGDYNPKTKTIQIKPKGEKRVITCTVMKVNANNLYLNMGKKPIEDNVEEVIMEEINLQETDKIEVPIIEKTIDAIDTLKSGNIENHKL